MGIHGGLGFEARSKRVRLSIQPSCVGFIGRNGSSHATGGPLIGNCVNDKAGQNRWMMILRAGWLVAAGVGLLLGSQSFAQEAALPLFDGKTLSGWTVTDFAGHGEVVVDSGTISIGAGEDLSGLTYTGPVPSSDFEVQLEARRVEGSDFFCGLTVPIGKSHCTLIVGGWGGAVVGISSIDGEDASSNASTHSRKFETGRWYRIRLRFQGHLLQAWIDDKPVIEVDVAGKTISLRSGSIELSKPFGITTYRTTSQRLMLTAPNQ